MSEELTAKKMERVAVENDVKTCEMTAERLAAELDDCALKIAGNNAEIAENDAQADAIRKAIEQAASNESKVDAGRVEEIRGKLGDLDKYKADLQQMVTELDTARQELMGELQNLKCCFSRWTKISKKCKIIFLSNINCRTKLVCRLKIPNIMRRKACLSSENSAGRCPRSET